MAKETTTISATEFLAQLEKKAPAIVGLWLYEMEFGPVLSENPTPQEIEDARVALAVALGDVSRREGK